jgi:hypothetical protein
MADTPTTRGAYRKQGLGDRSAAWGLASGLNGVFDSMDEAIHGFNGVSLATVNYTLSSTNYTTNEVRQRFHRFTNGGISANATITVPATQNWWLISNAVSGFDLVVSNGSNSVTIDDGLTALVATDGTNVYEFPMFSTLLAPDPGSNGIVVRTALGATVARTLTGPAAGITVTAGDGVSANPTLALANDLAAVEGLATTGLAVRTAADTWAARTLTGPAAGLSVAHGDGVSGNPTISLADDLLAVEALASTGLAVRTAADTWAVRTLSGPSAGVSIAHGDGVSGNPTISLANDLAAVEGLASTGLAVRTATDTWAARTLTGPAAGVSVTNGDGIAGNPTIALANDLSAVEGLASNGIAVRTATDTWAVRTLTAGDGITITHGNGISANPTVAVDINGSATAVGGVASDDEVLVYDTSASGLRKTTVASITGAGATTVSISANDTTPAVLATKLVAGTGITLTENNDGGNETLTVAAAGDVAGPGSSTDNALVRFDGAGGSAVQNSGWILSDADALTAGGTLDMGGYDLSNIDTLTATTVNADNLIEQGVHTAWVPAVAMKTRTTNGAASHSEELASNDIMLGGFDFDAATKEAVQFQIGMPESWNEGTVTAILYWKHPSTTTNFDVVWGVSGVAVGNDDALDAAFGTEITVTDTGGTTDDLYITAATSAITIAGTPAAGDLVTFQVARVAANGSDTLAVDATLIGVKILMTLDASTDA